MATRMRDLLAGAAGSLRYEPTEKRLRAYLAGQLVADTSDGLLVWQPGRAVPTYAVPVGDVIDSLRSAGVRNRGGAFLPDDPDLAGYLILEFDAFEWREEEAPIVAHPRDPFRRVDILPSARHVQIRWQGRLLAESSQPMLLFETLLPVRFYLSRDDIHVDLQPSDTVSHCAYKGRASYYSVPDGPADLAWTYPDPLHDAEPITDRVAFFDELVDVVVDGRLRDRPVTPWSH